MNQTFKKKAVAAAVISVFALGAATVYASEFATASSILVAGNPAKGIANDATVTAAGVVVNVAPDIQANAPLASSIIITENTAGDLAVGSLITVTAPTGTVFDNTGTTTRPTVSTKAVGGGAPTAFAISGGGTALTSQTTVGASAISADGTTMTLVVTTPTTAGAALASVVEIGSLRLLSTAASATANTNTAGLTFGVNVQAKGTANTVGSVDLLSRPRIISAVKSSSTTLDVTFDNNVSSTTATTAANYWVDPGNGTAVEAGAAAYVSGSKSKVRLTLPGAGTFPSSLGAALVALTTAGQANIQNYLNSTDVRADVTPTTTGYAPVVIMQSSDAAITSVTTSKTTMGAEGNAGGSSYASNIMDVNIKSTSGQPLMFKLYRSSDSNALPISTSNLSATIGGTALTKLSATAMGAHGQGDNADYYMIRGDQNTGDVTVRITAGTGNGTSGFAAAGDTAGLPLAAGAAGAALITADTVGIKVGVTLDRFVTMTSSSEVKVDLTPPAVIASGADKAVATARNKIKLTFNEAMDPATLTNVSNWYVADHAAAAVAGAVAGTALTVASVTSTDSKTVEITLANSMPVASTEIAVGVTRGDGTNALTSVRDAYGNPANTAAGTRYVAVGIAAPAGSIASVTGANNVVGNAGLSNGSTVQVTLNGDAGLSLDKVYFQAVDATDNTLAQGAVTAATALTTPMTESSSGNYTGVYSPYSAFSSSKIKIRSVVKAGTAPAAETDWAGAVYSGELTVDNTIPKMTAATYNSSSKSLKVEFSMAMNATVLSDRTSDFKVASTTGETVDVTGVSNVASDKKSITLNLLMDLDSTKKWFVDAVQAAVGETTATSDFGVAVVNANSSGNDRADITFTTTTQTATPTATAAVTGTVSSQTVGATFTPASADQGKQGNVYVVAVVPDALGGGVYSEDSAGGWTAWDGVNAFKVRSQNVTLGTTASAVNVATDMSLTGLTGTMVYAGYGIRSFGSDAAAYNSLMNNGTYSLICTIDAVKGCAK